MFDKEKSKKFKALKSNNTLFFEATSTISITLVCATLISPFILDEKVKFEKIQEGYLKAHRQEQKYKERVDLAFFNEYDKDYYKVYDNGIFIINEKGHINKYNSKDFYIVYGNYEGNKSYYLSYVKDAKKDFITKEDKSNLKIEGIIKFVDSTAGYNLFLKNKNNVKKENNVIYMNTTISDLEEVIKNWDGYLNNNVPQTIAIEDKHKVDMEEYNGKTR